MTIRDITKKDYNEFISMCTDFYNGPAASHSVPTAHFEKTFQKALIKENIICKIIEHDGQIAGYSLLFYYYSNEAGATGIMLDEIYIKPAFRSKGLGKSFIEQIKSIEHADFLRLEVNPENPRAKKLYESLGFSYLPYKSMVQ